MMKFNKYRRMIYGVVVVFLIGFLSAILHHLYETGVNDLSVAEIVAAGNRYLIFGSQRTNGVELYDLKQQKFIHFLVPEGTSVYSDPVVGISGTGYSIKHPKIFESATGTVELISFNLKSQDYRAIEKLPMEKFAALSLSPNEKKLAIVYAVSLLSPYRLGVYDINAGKIVKTFPANRFTHPVKIVWESDNRNVAIWSTLINGPAAIEIDIETGRSHVLDYFPLDVKGKYMLAVDSKKESVYWQNVESREKQIIVKNNATGHSFSLSQDGKYVAYGWLRGIGAETLTIMEVKSKRTFQLRMTEGTVLGLALW